MKLWNVLFRRKRGQGSSQQRKAAKQDGRSGTAASRDTGEGLSEDVDENLRTIVTELGGSDDLTIRKIGVDGADSSVVAFIYIDNLVDSSTVNQMLLHPLMSEIGESSSGKSSEEWYRKIRDRALAVGRVHELRSPEEALACILEGHTVVFLQGSATALAADTSGGDRRAVEEPGSQTVIRGPKESFTESIKTNLSLIRRRIKSPRLRVERKTLGRLTQTQIALVYLHGIAKASIVEEIRRRIDRIDTDSVLESAYVEEFIQDVPITFLFPIGDAPLPRLIEGGLPSVGWLSEASLLFILAPYLSKPRRSTAIAIGGVSLATFLLLTVVLVVLLQFGPELPGIMAYPMFGAAEIIKYGSFVERVDLVFICVWVATVYVKLCIFVFGTIHCFTHSLRIKAEKPFLWTISLLIFLHSLFSWSDEATFLHYQKSVSTAFLIACNVIVPALLWLGLKIKRPPAASAGESP